MSRGRKNPKSSHVQLKRLEHLEQNVTDLNPPLDARKDTQELREGTRDPNNAAKLHLISTSRKLQQQ